MPRRSATREGQVRAIVYNGTVRLMADYPDPTLESGEALVRVRLAGICNTDLEIARGYLSYRGVLGHEFVGEVVAAPATGWVGRRVVGEINAPCRHCDNCASISGNHCPNRTVLGIGGRDGTFADLVRLPLANLHLVPDAIPDEAAVFVEPLAAAFGMMERTVVRPTDRILVLGDGKLGQLCARVLALVGADVTLSGKHPEKLAVASAAVARAVLQNQLKAGLFDVVVDCTGSAAGFAEALHRTRPRGTLILKSTVADSVTLDLAPIVIDEILVVGSRCGPFAPAIRALSTGLVDVSPLLSSVYTLDDGLAALEEATKPGVLKVAIRP